MTDQTTPVAELKSWMTSFVAERSWERFHSPKNLAMSLAIEAAELMEHFQWQEVDESRRITDNPTALAAAGEELADVLSYALALANTLGLDLTTTLRDKMRKNAIKYPVPAAIDRENSAT